MQKMYVIVLFTCKSDIFAWSFSSWKTKTFKESKLKYISVMHNIEKKSKLRSFHRFALEMGGQLL